MSDDPDLFPAEALPENTGGHLTIEQKARLQRMVSGRRTSTRGVAVPFAAIGVLLLVLSGPAATASRRHLGGWAFLAVAAMIVAAPAFDPLAADVREGRVEAVEGAVAKRRVQSMSRRAGARYYLNIGGRQLRTYLSAYDAAPDSGYVRAYYLPRTRKLVNLERLPNPPLPAGPDEARGMFGRMARAFATGDPAAFAEARAKAAGLLDAGQELLREPSNPASGRVAGGLVREALVGTWTHPLVTVRLAEDGRATVTTMAGSTEGGHWSVDGHGRLLTDVTGTMEPTDAVLDGGRLLIQLEGRRLTLTRAADA